MAYNGSGTFTVSGTPFAAGATISAGAMNPKLTDIATGLTTAVTRDGQSPATADLPMGGFKHTNVANGVGRTDYAALGQVQDGAVIWGGTAGGTANALTLTLSPAITAYAAGQVIRFVSSAANSGAATIAVNGLAAQDLNKGDGTTPLAAGDIPTGHVITIAYDGTRFRLIGAISALGATLGVSSTAAAARTTLGATATGAAVFTAATATAGRSAINAAADLTTAPGAAGAMQSLESGSGSLLAAPAGGTWVCWWFGLNASGQVASNIEMGEVSGGTTLKAGVPGINYVGVAYRKA